MRVQVSRCVCKSADARASQQTRLLASKRVSETSDPQYSSHSGFGISIRSPIMDGLRRSAAQFLSTTERCWSGRTGLPAKQLPGQNPGRGFESPPLRFPVYGEFVFMQPLVFGINRDSAFAKDRI